MWKLNFLGEVTYTLRFKSVSFLYRSAVTATWVVSGHCLKFQLLNMKLHLYHWDVLPALWQQLILRAQNMEWITKDSQRNQPLFEGFKKSEMKIKDLRVVLHNRFCVLCPVLISEAGNHHAVFDSLIGWLILKQKHSQVYIILFFTTDFHLTSSDKQKTECLILKGRGWHLTTQIQFRSTI